MKKYAAIITCATVKGEQQTTAIVYGTWAVHRSLDLGSNEWAITQVATGYAIPRSHTFLLKKDQALAIVKILDAEHGDRKMTRRRGREIAEIIHRVLTRRDSPTHQSRTTRADSRP